MFKTAFAWWYFEFINMAYGQYFRYSNKAIEEGCNLYGHDMIVKYKLFKKINATLLNINSNKIIQKYV